MRAALFLLFASVAAAQHVPRPLVVNVDHHGFPTEYSFDVDRDGAPRFVWKTYEDHQEKIWTASFRDARRSDTQQLTAGGGVYWSPIYIADHTQPDSGWAVWQERHEGVWRIVGRRLERGFWEPLELFSEPGKDALMPAARAIDSRLALAWEDHSRSPQRIAVRVSDRPVRHVSPADLECYRPAFGDGSIFFDCYSDGRSSVYRIEPGDSPAMISGSSYAMAATAAASRVVWVSEKAVIGKGAIDQRHFVEDHSGPVVDLSHSLLSRIEPEVGPIWGYAGDRLHPMVLASGDAGWLLWERKIEHGGRSTLPGELLADVDGRKIRLHTGLVRYRIPEGAEARGGKTLIAGYDTQHNLIVEEIDLSADFPAATETVLTGWEPIDLPLPHWTPAERPTAMIDGAEHRLYWGDLHVHTSLTADAEGEVDELMHYARDKAAIDIVVMQENDAASWLNSNDQGAYRGQVLTDSEYALSVYFSRKYTEPGRFIALPGFEWSDRTDDGKANHRTTIYPSDWTPLLRHTEEDDFEQLCDIVEAAGGVMNSQHEVFRLVDRPCDANIEVASGWGVFINEPEKIHADLSAGFKVGFVATSDGHRRNPGVGGGLTGFWLRELTPEAAVEALKDHRVFATNGSRITMDARANGVFMGRDLEASGPVKLELRAASPVKPIVRAVLVRDGDEIHVSEGDDRKLAVEYVDRPGRGFHWYYWRVELEGESPDYPANIKVAEGHLGWTSPHRVEVR